MPNPISFREPTPKDGVGVNRLVEACSPLDTNSTYCNLLQCSHFSKTSVAAEMCGELVGFVSGYLVPERPDTLFVWQVAVDSSARGRGLASKMIHHLLESAACRDVAYLETTITKENQASWALFRSVANRHKAKLNNSVFFDREVHFENQHDSEFLIRIGPLQGDQSTCESLKLASNN